MSLTITEADLKKFSKRGHPEYVAAVLGLNREIESLKATLGQLGEISTAFARQGVAA